MRLLALLVSNCVTWTNYFTSLGSSSVKAGPDFSVLGCLGEHLGVCGGGVRVGMDTYE